jgi:hypothetical protein
MIGVYHHDQLVLVEMGVSRPFLSRLVSNYNPPELPLLSIWDFRCELPHVLGIDN